MLVLLLLTEGEDRSNMETTTTTEEMTTLSAANLSEVVVNRCTQEVLDFEPSCREFLESE